MSFQRGSGILLHITSLPSPSGIGDFGPSAYDFIELLVYAKQRYWQILPLNPTDDIFNNSPYSSPSAFAINPLLISSELLQQAGLITEKEAVPAGGDTPGSINFSRVRSSKNAILELAFARWQKKPDADYKAFLEEQNYWLEDYATYTALKKSFNNVSWIEWPVKFRDRDSKALAVKKKELEREINFVCFEQYIAHTQWMKLKTACNDRGIQIIGDLPIYIEHGSVDVWRKPELFKLNKEKRPQVVAGVPPDYFSKTGQRWGNPIYNWEKMQENNFDWWASRLGRNLKLFDIVRIDHFRGLVAFWQVPAEEKTAVVGEWIKAPTDALFDRLLQTCPDFNVIAEDLGLMSQDVIDALERYDLPGMKVLQFAFDDNLEKNAFLPHNYPKNCIVYPGTHDNNTTVGWHKNDATDHERWQIGAYVQYNVTSDNVHQAFMKLALSSRADVAIVSAQDVLGLDERARMNTPGTAEGNWFWRLRPNQLTTENLNELKSLTERTQRM